MNYSNAISRATAKPTVKPGKRILQRMLRLDANDSLPVTLRHERIYILPTSRGLAFLGVVAIMLLASMNYGLNLGYALSFILIGLFASCLLSTYMNLAQLQFFTATTSDIYAGNPIEFAITLRELNKRSRHSITVSDSNGANDCIDIKAAADCSAVLRIDESQRGLYSLGRLTISSNFPLGLWRGWGYIHAHIYTHVYPPVETPGPPISDRSPSDGSAIASVSLEREFKELKPYQKTDSPASVAWKTVAKGAGWYSKDFESAAASSNLTLRWQDTPDNMTLEKRLSRLCAWVGEAEQSAIAYSMELPEISVATGLGSAHKQRCLRLLAKFSGGTDG